MDVVKRFCKSDVYIRLAFTSFKISSMFSIKDCIPFALKSFIVYKFECASCNACYIGETYRHLSTRTREHLKTDKNSHIYKHIQSSENCKQSCDESCFPILDTASSKFSLKIKEDMHINWQKSELNYLFSSICV